MKFFLIIRVMIARMVLLTCFLLLGYATSYGQQNGRLSGQAKGSSGEILPGATVKIIEINRSAMTDREGNFSFEVPPGSYSLEVSYIAYDKFQRSGIAVRDGATITVDVILTESVNAMDEVVITALGISREEKEIGYAQQTISAAQLSTAASTNWSEGLKGKVAGLNIISGNTGPINSQSIQLRGTTSLDPGGNYALIVIDGVPMNQETTVAVAQWLHFPKHRFIR